MILMLLDSLIHHLNVGTMMTREWTVKLRVCEVVVGERCRDP